MSEFSDYLENAILDQTLGKTRTILDGGKTPYLALYINNPTDAGKPDAEAAWNGYVRLPVTFSPAQYGATSSINEIGFNPVSGLKEDGSTTITHIGIFDEVKNGNLLYHSALTNNKVLYNTDTLTFNVGAITISLN